MSLVILSDCRTKKTPGKTAFFGPEVAGLYLAGFAGRIGAGGLMIFGLVGVGGLVGGFCFLGFGWGSLLHPSMALLSATHSPSRIWTYSANVLNLMPVSTACPLQILD